MPGTAANKSGTTALPKNSPILSLDTAEPIGPAIESIQIFLPPKLTIPPATIRKIQAMKTLNTFCVPSIKPIKLERTPAMIY
ncbi:MAG: hypothetical protein K0Q53_2799, partial [Massilibacillus sp.]|nr:hypothetical protein [Massilibacillus sp.]